MAGNTWDVRPKRKEQIIIKDRTCMGQLQFKCLKKKIEQENFTIIMDSKHDKINNLKKQKQKREKIVAKIK